MKKFLLLLALCISSCTNQPPKPSIIRFYSGGLLIDEYVATDIVTRHFGISFISNGSEVQLSGDFVILTPQ